MMNHVDIINEINQKEVDVIVKYAIDKVYGGYEIDKQLLQMEIEKMAKDIVFNNLDKLINDGTKLEITRELFRVIKNIQNIVGKKIKGEIRDELEYNSSIFTIALMKMKE